MSETYDPDDTPGTRIARETQEHFNKLHALNPTACRLYENHLQKEAIKRIYKGHPIAWLRHQVFGRYGCIAQYWTWFWKWRFIKIK